MNLSQEDVLRVAKLARLKLNNEEISRFQEQLSKLLNYFSMLSEVDTENIEPTYQPFPIENMMGDDIIEPSLPAQTILLNAPACEGSGIKVKAVME